MIADSGGGHNNGTEGSHRNASQDLRRATSLLRLLKSGDAESLEDPELQREFQRLHELLDRIDRLAEGVAETAEVAEHRSDTPAQTAEPRADAPTRPRATSSSNDSESGDSQPPRAAERDRSASDEPPTEQATAASATSSTDDMDSMNERCRRWWVHFNGDLSLERLSKLRVHLIDSPFTIDTRYDEITDGLIVMRVVTEEHISMDQLNWILRQLMDLVGLDHNSAIVSKQ